MSVALAYLYAKLSKVKPGETLTIRLTPEEARAMKEGINDYKDTIYRDSIKVHR